MACLFHAMGGMYEFQRRGLSTLTIEAVNQPSLLPEIPSPLAESSAIALEWPRLREYIATRTTSPLGRAWITALEPSANLPWIETQHTRTAELRAMLAAGGTFDFNGLFDPTTLLDKPASTAPPSRRSRSSASSPSPSASPPGATSSSAPKAARNNGLASAVSIAALTAPLLDPVTRSRAAPARLTRKDRARRQPLRRRQPRAPPHPPRHGAAAPRHRRVPPPVAALPRQRPAARKTNSSPSAAIASSFPSRPSSDAAFPASSTAHPPPARPSSSNPSKPSSRTTSSSASSTKNNQRSTASSSP